MLLNAAVQPEALLETRQLAAYRHSVRSVLQGCARLAPPADLPQDPDFAAHATQSLLAAFDGAAFAPMELSGGDETRRDATGSSSQEVCIPALRLCNVCHEIFSLQILETFYMSNSTAQK